MNTEELNPDELKLLENRDYMPMKVEVCRKIESWLSSLHDQLRMSIENDESLPDEFRQSKGRISKGENYKSYAYRVLDYPTLIDKEDIFLFRTLVLWGDAIGFHLILSGKYGERYGKKIDSLILANKNLLKIKVSFQRSPWIWESKHNQIEALSQELLPELLTHHREYGFTKLSTYISLSEYSSLQNSGKTYWDLIRDSLLNA